jgi:DNA-binding transcriptional MerR regulator
VADEGLTAGAVARRLGVAVTTLRTWHQRYDLGPSGHEPGRHRRYTAADVARLEQMQRLTAEGVPPGEAARWVLAPAGSSPRPAAPRPGTAATATGLARAALRLDGAAVRAAAAAAVRQLGVIDAWDHVLRPVLAAIGERHARTGGLIEVEHLLSGCLMDVFGGVARPPGQRVLLACTDEEQHSLPLTALAAALAEAGAGSRLLGARVPPAALAAAVASTGDRRGLATGTAVRDAGPTVADRRGGTRLAIGRTTPERGKPIHTWRSRQAAA